MIRRYTFWPPELVTVPIFDWLWACSNWVSQQCVSEVSLKVQPPDDCSQSVSWGVCGRLSLRGSGGKRERETRPCFSVWHLVAHLRFLLQRQWGFWAHWQHRAHTKAQKNTAIHSNKFSARLYVWAHKCWDEAMQMQGVHRAQQKELSSRCVNCYDVIQRLLYFCLEALRWAFWSLHSLHFETECDKFLL